jgi:hemoglobin-like flavoprotein
MTENHKQLVQSTFAKIASISDQAAAMFYARLFEIDPTLRTLFHSNLAEQGRKLMQVLGFAVRGLGDVDRIVPAVEDLARRHVTYGVRAEHYETVGTALLWTLEKGLGEAFTAATREAWTEAYNLLACIMKDAAYARAASRSA